MEVLLIRARTFHGCRCSQLQVQIVVSSPTLKANMGFKALLLLRLELLRRLARPGFLMFGPRIQLWTVGAAPVFGVEAFLTIHNWSFSRNHAKIKKLDVAHPHKSRCARDMHAAILFSRKVLGLTV